MQNVSASDMSNLRTVRHAMTSILFLIGRNLPQTFKMQLSKKAKIFFVGAFINSTSNFEHFEKKDDLHEAFPKLRTAKDVVT